MGVETGGCPHTAIREDASINLEAVDADDASASRARPRSSSRAAATTSPRTFSPELSDLTLYVIDVAGGRQDPAQGRARASPSPTC